MKETDNETLLRYLETMSVSYYIYSHPRSIVDDALKEGATSIISVRDVVDFAFNAKGKLVGTSTDAIGSFEKRRK